MEQYTNIVHTFEPVYNEKSKILILGTFPSVKSRENEFYYGHERNRFWKMVSIVTESKLPVTIEEKKSLLLSKGIALWDVIYSCSIKGSSDSSIKDVVPNDISKILCETDINIILANGNKAYELYKKYIYPNTQREAVRLPSTSPANAAWSLERLCREYKKYLLI